MSSTQDSGQPEVSEKNRPAGGVDSHFLNRVHPYQAMPSPLSLINQDLYSFADSTTQPVSFAGSLIQ